MSKLKNELKGIIKRNMIYKQLDSILEENEYIKVEPDYFEDLEEFTKINTRIKQEKMVKVITPSARIASLRPDVTTNIMKQIIPYLKTDSTFKLFYNSTVFRQTRKGIKQSRQFGMEVFGDESENDLIVLINRLFNEFKIDFKLDIGNQLFVENLINDLKMPLNKEKELKSAIRFKNKKEIKFLLNDYDAEVLKNILSLNGTYNEVSKMLNSYGYNSSNIKDILKISKDFSFSNMSFDLSLISEYDYYSGIVLQGYIENDNAPILYGGRYDRLTKQYGKNIKAFGVSFDVEAFVKECSL